MRATRRAVASMAMLLPALFVACRNAPTESPAPVATVAVTINGAMVRAEVAATDSARETGLMNRQSLGADAGMLFVFAVDQQVQQYSPGFWMKNTLFDLSIAFMDSNKRVVGMQDMAARDTVTLHRPSSPYRYALEVNKGWFASHGVTTGAIASFTLP